MRFEFETHYGRFVNLMFLCKWIAEQKVKGIVKKKISKSSNRKEVVESHNNQRLEGTRHIKAENGI